MVNYDYLYNPDAAKKNLNKKCFSDKKLGFQVIEHGTILPYKIISSDSLERNVWGAGGIVDSEGKFINQSFVVNGHGESYTPPQN